MIPEPTTELWLWLRRFWDTNIWPSADEDAARRMGDAWQELATALRATIDQADGANNLLAGVWRDVVGVLYHRNIDLRLNGDGYRAVATSMEDMARLCHDFGRQVAYVKDQIYSELILNALYFAGTFALPPVIGDILRYRLLSALATRFSNLIRSAAGLVEHSGTAMSRASHAILTEGSEGALADGIGQELDRRRGFRAGHDWKQTGVSTVAEVFGGWLGGKIAPAGMLGSVPATRLASALRLGERGTNVLQQVGHGAVVNPVTSPIAGTAVQAAADGNLLEVGPDAYAEAVVTQGPMAGVLASSRVGAVQLGGAGGQLWSGAVKNRLDASLPSQTLPQVTDPSGPPPPSLTDPAGSTGVKGAQQPAAQQTAAQQPAAQQPAGTAGGAGGAAGGGSGSHGHPASDGSAQGQAGKSAGQQASAEQQAAHPTQQHNATRGTENQQGTADPQVDSNQQDAADGQSGDNQQGTADPQVGSNQQGAADGQSADNQHEAAGRQGVDQQGVDQQGADQRVAGSDAVPPVSAPAGGASPLQTGPSATHTSAPHHTSTANNLSTGPAASTTNSASPTSTASPASTASPGPAHTSASSTASGSPANATPRNAQNPGGRTRAPDSKATDRQQNRESGQQAEASVDPAADPKESSEQAGEQPGPTRIDQEPKGESQGAVVALASSASATSGTANGRGDEADSKPRSTPSHTTSAAPEGPPSGDPGGRGPVDPPSTRDDGAIAGDSDDFDPSSADVVVGALSNESGLSESEAQQQFVEKAQRAFVAAMNARDGNGQFTQKAAELLDKLADRVRPHVARVAVPGDAEPADPQPAGGPMPPGGGYFAGQVYSSEHQNRAWWTFGQPGKRDEVVLELREVRPPPPSYDDRANPIPARRRLPLDWAFGHQGAGLMPPGVVVSPQSFAQFEKVVQALIVAGHVVTVTLTEVPGKYGRATLEIDVSLEHERTGRTTYPGRSLAGMIDALTRHRVPSAADPTQADDSQPDDTPPQSLTTDDRRPGDDGIIRGVAESLLWFSGVRRLMADWDAVERQIHAALARDDVLKAAEIRSVRRDLLNPNKYLVTPMNGAPFEIIVRAATIDGGHPGTFSVRADGTGPATLSVSARSGDASVARPVANLLHQVAHAGRPSEPSLLRPGSEVRQNTTLSRQDGGRLAEARLLNSELKPSATPRYRALRRQDLRNELRTLLGHMGVARGQQDRQFRLALLGKSDGPMLDKHTRGWGVNDWRSRQRVYFARELVFGGLPAIAASTGSGVATGSLAAAVGLAGPVLAAGALHAIAQRWIDGHRNRIKVEGYRGRLGDVAKRNPGIYGRIETDPFGMAGKPAEEVDPAKLVPKKALYQARHLVPAVVGATVAWALAPTPLAFIAPAIYFGVSAVLRPVIDRFIDERRNPLEMLRWEELMTRVATDPARYQNQVADYFETLANRLTGGTETIARLARGEERAGSLHYKTMARAELAEQIPGYLRRLVPGQVNPNELDPTEVSTIISSFGESLIFGALNNFLGALPAAGVNTALQLKGDQAYDKLVDFSLDTVEKAESRALFEAMRSQGGQAVELVELVEKLAESLQDPAQGKLVHRILERFRNNSPAAPVPSNPLPAAPTPPAPTNPGNQPTAVVSFLAQTLNVVPPIVTLGVVNAVDPVLGLDPTVYKATVFAAVAQLLTAPVAKWMANRESAMHWVHEMDANNEFAIGRRQLADKLGALLFIQQQTQNAAQAKIDALRPGPRSLSPTNVARSVELFFRIRPTSNDFTNYVRAAVRAARLSIGHGPGQNTRQGYQDRQDRHLALDEIEQQADRLDDLAETVRRSDDPGARAELKKTRAEVVAVLGKLPALGTVDPSTGRRAEGDAITRTRAAVEEARRRLQGEPGSTPLRVRRLIALNRVGEVMKVLDRYLAIAEAGGSELGVEAALNELGPRINAFKALQYRAGVAGDTRLDPIPVRQEVKARLLSGRQVKGNATKLEGFVAEEPIGDVRKLLNVALREILSPMVRDAAQVASVELSGDGNSAVVTTTTGESFQLFVRVGRVADGHPAEFRLSGASALVTINGQLAPDDVRRAVAHEIGELARLVAGERAKADVLTPDGDLADRQLSPHDHGRIAELRLLLRGSHESFYRAERRALIQHQMAALLAHLGLGPGQEGAQERRGLLPADLLEQLDRAESPNDDLGFELVRTTVMPRRASYLPQNPDPKWGLRRYHLNKHVHGSGKFALRQVDPQGNDEIWNRYFQQLLSMPEWSESGEKGAFNVFGVFPRADGSGQFLLGIRLSPRPDGSFDVITILTQQKL